MTQTFKNIDVDVKLNRNEFEAFNVYDGYELWCFDWDNEPCHNYGEDEDEDEDEDDDVYLFTISKDTESRYGKHYKPNIKTVEEARMVIEKFNKDFGLDWGAERFKLRCTSTINL